MKTHIVFCILLFICTCISAQTKSYLITPNVTAVKSSKYENYFLLYKVLKEKPIYDSLDNIINDKVDQKWVIGDTSSNLFRGDEIKKFTSISGTFRNVGDYYEVQSDCGKYFERQLIDKRSVTIDKTVLRTGDECYGQQISSLMQEVNTGELIYGTGAFLYECGTDAEELNFFKLLENNGFRVTKTENYSVIETKTGKVKLTPDIYKNVNMGNIGYINEIESSINQYNTLVEKADIISDKISKYVISYKNKTISGEGMNKWRLEIQNADKIYAKIESLKGYNEENLYNFQQQIKPEVIEKHDTFCRLLNGSKQILGL